MGISSLEKAGLAIASIYLGGQLFPQTFNTFSGGLLGTSAAGQAGSLNFLGPSQGISGALTQGAQGTGSIANLGLGSGIDSSGNLLSTGLQASTAGTITEGANKGQAATGLSNPAVLSGLFAAGASLGSTLLAGEDADKTREATRENQEAGREHQSAENTLTREQQAAEADKTRSFQAEQNAATREFQEEQARKRDQLNLLIAAQNSRNAIAGRRGQRGSQGGGSSLSANVANLNQAILA